MLNSNVTILTAEDGILQMGSNGLYVRSDCVIHIVSFRKKKKNQHRMIHNWTPLPIPSPAKVCLTEFPD
ncbi:hypothetical protein DERF_005717 [Dermatophagoides farinae]|uniref:Uncharacterized protein n=1 Tax=Dermatophagoides farinae TaxID=6954 RepID=A0A922L6G5_DERFA|nr:hypothetical protein DERF_005717 [Dermatophagoides farinae]